MDDRHLSLGSLGLRAVGMNGQHYGEKTRMLIPPGAARTDEVEFAKWVKEVGHRLLRAGLPDVEMTVQVQEDGGLFLTVFCDDFVGSKIKAALYN